MAETDNQSSIENAGRTTAAATRRMAGAAADAGRQTADTAADAARAGVDAEQRSFAAASQAAEGSMEAGREIAAAGQNAMRRVGDRAADFWRASLSPMSEFQGEFGRWVDHIWRQSSPTRMQTASPFAGMMLAPFTGQPLADLRETDTTLELRVELPGLKAGDVQLALKGDTLLVSGEKTEEVEQGQGAYRVSERRFGRFERSFVLPAEADHGRIEASFSDGLLKVTIAKSEQAAEPKTIPISG
jgi:HSP20 family protein